MSDSDEYFEHLILSGAVEFAGIDSDTGEMLYSFSPDLETLDPDLYATFLADIEQEVYILWQKGFLDMNVAEDNPTIMLTEKALDDEAIKNELTVQQKQSLIVIKNIMMQ